MRMAPLMLRATCRFENNNSAIQMISCLGMYLPIPAIKRSVSLQHTGLTVGESAARPAPHQKYETHYEAFRMSRHF